MKLNRVLFSQEKWLLHQRGVEEGKTEKQTQTARIEQLSGDTTKRELMKGRKGRIPHGMLGNWNYLELSAFSRIFKAFSTGCELMGSIESYCFWIILVLHFSSLFWVWNF